MELLSNSSRTTQGNQLSYKSTMVQCVPVVITESLDLTTFMSGNKLLAIPKMSDAFTSLSNMSSADLESVVYNIQSEDILKVL